MAAASGVVSRVSTSASYGLLVELDHGNGVSTRYAHCSTVRVRSGQRVLRGDVVATVGSSGLSTGPHLHYEIRVNGRPVDPLTYAVASTTGS